MAKEKILIVDDEEPIRQALRASLEGEGYDIQEAENGKAAVEKCKYWRPDLAILDINMPVMDGQMAAIEIKYDERLKHTKIIFLSANADEDSKNFGLGHGAETYLTKPFKIDDLIKTVDEILHPFGEKETAENGAAAPQAPAPEIDPEARKAYLENLKKKFGK